MVHPGPAPGRRPFYAFDINASYQITDDLSVRAGINNLWQPSAPVRNNTVATTSGIVLHHLTFMG